MMLLLCACGGGQVDAETSSYREIFQASDHTRDRDRGEWALQQSQSEAHSLEERNLYLQAARQYASNVQRSQELARWVSELNLSSPNRTNEELAAGLRGDSLTPERESAEERSQWNAADRQAIERFAAEERANLDRTAAAEERRHARRWGLSPEEILRASRSLRRAILWNALTLRALGPAENVAEIQALEERMERLPDTDLASLDAGHRQSLELLHRARNLRGSTPAEEILQQLAEEGFQGARTERGIAIDLQPIEARVARLAQVLRAAGANRVLIVGPETNAIARTRRVLEAQQFASANIQTSTSPSLPLTLILL